MRNISELKIGGQKISPDSPPYLVAEISANHTGSLSKALDIITAAKNSGCHAVKIQTYRAETMTLKKTRGKHYLKNGPWQGLELFGLYKKAETPFEWHKKIFDHAKNKKITLFSTPFDETAVDLLESLNAPAYKISSFELVDIPLIQYVAKTKKPLLFSTGLASKDEIWEAVEAAREAGCTALSLLHCVSNYPATHYEARLQRIQELIREFKVPVGFSDHTRDNLCSLTAVGLGACIIEKHFTLSKNSKSPDKSFSIEPKQMKNLCQDARRVWEAVGTPNQAPSKCELKNKFFRRSLYFSQSLPKGAILQITDLRRLRPALGLPPRVIQNIVGKKLRRSVAQGSPVTWADFNESLKKRSGISRSEQ